jgi:hypothetical protein
MSWMAMSWLTKSGVAKRGVLAGATAVLCGHRFGRLGLGRFGRGGGADRGTVCGCRSR